MFNLNAMLAMHGLAFTLMFDIHPLLSINLPPIEGGQDLQEFATVRVVRAEMRAAGHAIAEEAVAAVIATANLTEKGETVENIVMEPAVQVVHHHHHALPSHLPAAPAVQAVREMIAEHDSCRYILPQYRILFSSFRGGQGGAEGVGGQEREGGKRKRGDMQDTEEGMGVSDRFGGKGKKFDQGKKEKQFSRKKKKF